jgi:hypothetical protein
MFVTLLYQIGTRELQADLRSEVNQQTGTRELTAALRSEVNQQTVTGDLMYFVLVWGLLISL